MQSIFITVQSLCVLVERRSRRVNNFWIHFIFSLLWIFQSENVFCFVKNWLDASMKMKWRENLKNKFNIFTFYIIRWKSAMASFIPVSMRAFLIKSSMQRREKTNGNSYNFCCCSSLIVFRSALDMQYACLLPAKWCVCIREKMMCTRRRGMV